MQELSNNEQRCLGQIWTLQQRGKVLAEDVTDRESLRFLVNRGRVKVIDGIVRVNWDS